MRDIKTLLQIVIDSLEEGDKEGFYNFGICGEIDDLLSYEKLDIDENQKLHSILTNNKPSVKNKYSSFLSSDYWKGSNFWWFLMDEHPETRQIRIDYLTQLKNSL